MRKTISVAMTTYNGERFLREQLDSIYNQTLLPDEVIVCDDNSQDETCTILEEYHQKRGLKYYVNNPGLGVNENFYRAISLCTCDYISLSDQDDIWLPNKVELTYNKLCEIDSGIPCAVSCQHHDIDANNNVIKKNSSIRDTDGYADTLLGYGVSQGCSMMFNKELASYVLKHKNDSSQIEEIWYDLFIGCVAAIIGRKYNLGIPLMLYRHHDKNVLARLKGRQSLKEWVVSRNNDTFTHFVPDSRIRNLSAMYTKLDGDISNENVRLLLSKIDAISHSKYYLKNLLIILSVSECSVFRKLSILAKSLSLQCLRRYYRL